VGAALYHDGGIGEAGEAEVTFDKFRGRFEGGLEYLTFGFSFAK
jgi:hypothetical protein